jgi:hypothetical protein
VELSTQGRRLRAALAAVLVPALEVHTGLY